MMVRPILVPVFSILSAVPLLLSCDQTSVGQGAPQQVEVPPPDELGRQLDDVLGFTYESRHLSLGTNAAWQILHGALAYKQSFLVDKQDGARVSAVGYLLEGGPMKGFDTEVGTEFEPGGPQGLRFLMDPGSKAGQGHQDQWLAVLAQSGLSPEQTIRAHDGEFTIADCVRQVQWDLPRNVDREYSWTLIALTTYLPTDATWQAQDGETWSIPQLVQSEAERPLGDGACGGTHRMIGLTMALNRHLEQGGRLEGPWKLADERIQQAIRAAQQYQNADGSFSKNYFARPGRTPDLAQDLGASGHMLEFLTLALPAEQLEAPWVQRAVVHLLTLLHKTRGISLECGGLYHAVHGLMLYRQRAYGAEFVPGPVEGAAE